MSRGRVLGTTDAMQQLTDAHARADKDGLRALWPSSLVPLFEAEELVSIDHWLSGPDYDGLRSRTDADRYIWPVELHRRKHIERESRSQYGRHPVRQAMATDFHRDRTGEFPLFGQPEFPHGPSFHLRAGTVLRSFRF